MANSTLTRRPLMLASSLTLLLASTAVLSGCTSSAAADAASEMGGKGKGKIRVTDGGGGGTTTTTPPPTTVTATPPTASGPFDTSIGNGVDAYGYANLPLRAGAHHFFVS